jgi:hypothetical protein
MIQLGGFPKRNEQILSQRVSGTLVLLNVDDGQYYTLNEVGSRVWELCDGTTSVAEMAALICRDFDAPLDTVRADVLELIAELADGHLVTAPLASS